MMRVAIYHNLPSGGGKRALFEIVKRLAQHYKLDVYTLSTAEHDFCDLRPYCNQHIISPFLPLPLASRPFGRLNQAIRSLDLFRLQTLQRQIATQIDKNNYDVVFVHNCQFGQSPSLLKFLQTPSVYYCQEPPRSVYEPPMNRPYNHFSTIQRVSNLFDPLPHLYRMLLRFFDRKNVCAAGLILVNSYYSREVFYHTYGIFPRVGYLGVDIEEFYPLGLSKEQFVLSVGSLNPRKGFDFLIEGLAQISEGKRPTLVLVSNFTDAMEKEYLEQLAYQLGVALEIKVMVNDQELVQLYNQARLVVYTPIMEPFGFVPLEAMACGTPVIGVKEGGIRESVPDGVAGILIERDTMVFANIIKNLWHDNSLLAELGRQGVAHVEANWTWEKSVDGIEKMLCYVAEVKSA
jgi:glycosyltransferase involved in cell wall biosynthesis